MVDQQQAAVAPNLDIRLNDSVLPPFIMKDMVSLIYRMDILSLDRFELLFSSPHQIQPSGLEDLFAKDSVISFYAGYGEERHFIGAGIIDQIEANFRNGLITITGFDGGRALMFQPRRKKGAGGPPVAGKRSLGSEILSGLGASDDESGTRSWPANTPYSVPIYDIARAHGYGVALAPDFSPKDLEVIPDIVRKEKRIDIQGLTVLGAEILPRSKTVTGDITLGVKPTGNLLGGVLKPEGFTRPIGQSEYFFLAELARDLGLYFWVQWNDVLLRWTIVFSSIKESRDNLSYGFTYAETGSIISEILPIARAKRRSGLKEQKKNGKVIMTYLDSKLDDKGNPFGVKTVELEVDTDTVEHIRHMWFMSEDLAKGYLQSFVDEREAVENEARIRLIGIPTLKAGQIHLIEGLKMKYSEDLSGYYRLRRVRHSFTPQRSYVTTCRAERISKKRPGIQTPTQFLFE